MSLLFHVTLSVFLWTVNTETINCKWWQCTNQEIWCPDHENCIVDCERCSGSTIYCPRTANNCTVICSKQSSCEHTIIDAKSFASNVQTLTVIIQESYAFKHGIVKCPLYNGKCDIHCNNHHACTPNITIDGRDTSYTNISLVTDGVQSFYNGSIYASSHGTLDIHCDGYEACSGTNPIQTYTNTLSLNINATGSLVLAQSNVYCPSNNACNLDIKGTDAMQNSTIYAIESFDDVDFLCDSTFDRGCSDITMVCDTNYSSSCLMQMTSTNLWQCANPTNYCNNYAETKPHETNDDFVSLRIEFHYIFGSENDQNMSLDVFSALFTNISNELIAADIKRIDNACVESIEYDMNIDQNEANVIVDAMIYVCNEKTKLVLSNLADIIIDEPIYISMDDDSRDFNAEHASSDTLESFEVISIIFGSVIASCVMIIIVLCCINGKKDAERYRINTISCASKYRQANRDESGRELPSMQNISVAEVLERVMSETDDNPMKFTKVSIDISGIDNPAIVPHYEANSVISVTPYAPDEDKAVMDHEPGSSVADEYEFKQWFISNVGLPEYHQHFIQQGYNSLDKLTQINCKEQLEAIGVFVERDITKILDEIEKLDHSNHTKKDSEGIPRKVPLYQRHSSEGHDHRTKLAAKDMA